jgi:hypothetical protein
MRAGKDLVLAVAQEHGVSLPRGVALEDFLGPTARIAVDAQARELYHRWRADHAQALTLEGVDLTSIWEVEMLAQCFLPAAWLLHALPPALLMTGTRRLATRSLDAGTARLVGLIASSSGVAVQSESETSPTGEPTGRTPSRLMRAINCTGVPPRVRGDIVCMPYWPLDPVISVLARRPRGLRPVAARMLLPSLGSPLAIGVAASGGWMGVAGERLCAASRKKVRAAIREVGASGMDDPLCAAIDAHALGTLSRIAGETLAHVWHARRALAGGNVRLGMIPFDCQARARTLLVAMGAAGVPSLLVQHGFLEREGGPPEMTLADHLAIWSERDPPVPPDRGPYTVAVTGNPGAAHLADRRSVRSAFRGRSIVLVDYPGRMSSRVDSRVSMRHVLTALNALAAVRPGTHAVIRPHPSDRYPDAYLRLAPAQGALKVEVDAETAIEPLLTSGDLCIGSLSTATLQACALGVPTVVLDITGIERAWPFCMGALPVGARADELSDAVAAALVSREIAGRDAALDALGVRSDATERVVDLVAEVAR